MKLVAYFSLFIIITVALAVSTVGYFTFNFTKEVLIKEIGQKQQEQAHEALAIIDRTLYHKYQEIQLISDANPIEDVFISGKFTAEAEQRLQEFTLQTGPWDKLELFTIKGETVSQYGQETEKHLEKHDNEGKTAFNLALQGKVYISDVFISKETGKPTMIFSAPVKNKKQSGNPIIGVVIGKFSWPIIMEILDDISSANSHLHLFNKEGMTIATPTIHKDEILQHDLTYIPIVQQALQGECSSSSFLLEEEPHQEGDHHAVSKPVSSLISCSLQQGYLGFKKKGWGLVIETPQSLILKPVEQLTSRFMLISFLVLLLSIPLIFILSRIISKPIRDLAISNKLVSEGKFKEAQQLQHQRNIPSEINELIETRQIALKGLVAKSELEQKQKELEKKIAELAKWEMLTVGRELRIKELKDRVKKLEGNHEKKGRHETEK
jgi:hypothetical protein